MFEIFLAFIAVLIMTIVVFVCYMGINLYNAEKLENDTFIKRFKYSPFNLKYIFIISLIGCIIVYYYFIVYYLI